MPDEHQDRPTIVIYGPPTIGFNIEQIGEGESPEVLAKKIMDKYNELKDS